MMGEEFTPDELSKECFREADKRREVYKRQAETYGSGVLTELQQRRIDMMDYMGRCYREEALAKEGDMFAEGS